MVYPHDDEHLRTVLNDLGQALAGEAGPYVLAGLRWGQGPLYVRYGTFTGACCPDDDGVLVPALLTPDGALVPEIRAPAFAVPAWVELPVFLAPDAAARAATTFAGTPYRIDAVLHLSNGGGVYRALDTRTGEPVVLKEARPHAGLVGARDAVARLHAERASLRRLAGPGIAPRVLDWMEVAGHCFLVMEFVPGPTLHALAQQRHPLAEPDPGSAVLAAYTTWAVDLCRAVEEAVATAHRHGVVINDLHPANIIVTDAGRPIRLIDFEMATGADEPASQVVAAPGYRAPRDRRGADVDRYALACLRLALFTPLVPLLDLDPAKAHDLADAVRRRFALPDGFLDDAVREITRRPGTGPPTVGPRPRPGMRARDWSASREAMVRAVLASATPRRDDRLFPGDIAQFTRPGGGVTMAHGAAGVLYALDAVGAPRYEEGEAWLLRHTDPPPPGTPPGFYDGIAGIAVLLHRLHHTQRALDMLNAAVADGAWRSLGPDLYGGLAGFGLACIELAGATPDPSLGRAARQVGHVLAQLVIDGAPVTGPGLLHGTSGAALLFLRLYEHEPDPALLDLAETALHQDLGGCVLTRHGALDALARGTRSPFLDGSAGIGMVLDDYLVHRDAPGLRQARRGIVTAARASRTAAPGLFRGTAGCLLAFGTVHDAPRSHLPFLPRCPGPLRQHLNPAQSLREDPPSSDPIA